MCKAIDDLIADGNELGKQQMAKLVQILLQNNRQDLLMKVIQDEKLRNKLLSEYHII